MKKVLLVAGSFAWGIGWAVSIWLQRGPYAAMIEAELAWSGSYEPSSMETMAATIGCAPIIINLWGVLTNWDRVVFRVAIAVALTISLIGFYEYLSQKEAHHLKDWNELDSYAGFFTKDFTFDDLRTEFDYSNIAGVIHTGRKSETFAYVRSFTGSGVVSKCPVILQLSEKERKALEEKEQVGHKRSSPPAGTGIAQARQKEKAKADDAAKGWSVTRTPIPYLIRKELGLEGNFTLVITPGFSRGFYTLLVSIGTMLVAGLLIYYYVKDRKLWQKS